MASLDNIRKRVEEKKRIEEQSFQKAAATDTETVDHEEVERIVKKMKKKYVDQGVEFEEVGGKLRDLRGMIVEGEGAKIKVQKVENLRDFKNPFVQKIGGIYLGMQGIMLPVNSLLKKLPLAKDLGYYLYSANMRYSVAQYLAISTVVGVMAFFLGLVLFAVLAFVAKLPLIIAPLGGLGAFVFVTIGVLLIPKSNANKRADAISAELPFALRHMASELRAGIGLYKTMQAVATSDYGVLSEEFARTINEIEEGIDTKDALRNFALRTQSKALRSALLHVIRAMTTGGNLSGIMSTIAEDVSFELRMKMRDFGEKINFFGVIFIVGAIVFPVFIAIIGGITNAPLGLGSFKLEPMIIAAIYLAIMPLILGYLIFYLTISQPRV
ncbi:type II secretion system F family protein [Candidatus Micrarchaeota archaeon]|nr:type II secretion system F family protein [Candidatus Micrarchaeota archaeon]MBU1939263.1 type II secretion system F family protein [Candidatus Micrarchaeota archaeon]